MSNIILGLIVLSFILFLLSLAAPAEPKGAFWKLIRASRAAMDALSYWFLTGCLFLAAAAAAVCALSKLLT